MRSQQAQWTAQRGWVGLNEADFAPTLVLVFGARLGLEQLSASADFRVFKERVEPAVIVGCSTAGQIHGTTVVDDGVTVTLVRFERTQVRAVAEPLTEGAMSLHAGRRLAERLAAPDLRHLFVLSDGLTVNGSELVHGLVHASPPGVQVTGGLAADGAAFHKTLVCFGGESLPGRAVAVGFYGDALEVGCASLGGWDPFGTERLVTRAAGNVLYEFDGRSALALYKQYLGEQSSGLPASGLLFPLSLRVGDHEPVVRTMLAVDEAAQSITFAGDIPVGAYARLMKANFDRLIEGASKAARGATTKPGPELAVLISCVGRKLVLRSRIEEEVEAARDQLGAAATLTGFYSYGEISPFNHSARCELHNQTMAITTFRER